MNRKTLLQLLGDHHYHSGERLSSRLGVSRTAIWKGIHELKERGLHITSRHGKGYRLEDEIELLSKAEIARGLNDVIDEDCIAILFETDSTNQYLLEKLGGDSFHGHVVLAEYQHAGRGRRGRSWASAFARGVYLSIGWRFDSPPASLNALSLAAGVALIEALREMGVTGAGLKWPNDVICDDKKLGGILLQSRSETAASCDVVIGIGVNVDLPDPCLCAIDQPATDIARQLNIPFSRNALASGIIKRELLMLNNVAQEGTADYVEKWKRLDCSCGRDAELHMPNAVLHGVVEGVDSNGLLLMNIDGETQTFSSGDLSLRLAA